MQRHFDLRQSTNSLTLKTRGEKDCRHHHGNISATRSLLLFFLSTTGVWRRLGFVFVLARQPGSVSPFFFSVPLVTRCWFSYIGRGTVRFGCIQVCFHSPAGQISRVPEILTHELRAAIFYFLSHVQGFLSLSRYVCMYVQQISFHVRNLRFCSLFLHVDQLL
jgi:hypothetical protein